MSAPRADRSRSDDLCWIDSSLRERLPCRGYSRNFLQIICNCYVFPASQESADTIRDGAADFHDEMAAGLQGSACSGDEVFDDFEAGRSGEHRGAGLEFADFELNLVFFRLADVGRIGDNEIERTRFEAVE